MTPASAAPPFRSARVPRTSSQANAFGATSEVTCHCSGEVLWVSPPTERGLPADRCSSCRPASDFVTGVTLPVDGGYSVADRLRET